MNAGSTTPIVAMDAPKIPPCDMPINVARFIETGPGVDSAIAIKLSISSAVSQLLDITLSCIRGIIAYPPPKETAPIFRKVKKSFR